VSEANRPEGVRCTEKMITIPTYPVPDADPNPMFFENRVYQGSSGKVYPNPFTDRVSLEKTDVTYRAIFLENEYIQLTILPEIGGRIHTGLDKTNHYDFFYRQNVIKPALVGLLGPWISGGVEFNWPQHHRPSTYMPVHYSIEEERDGSCTVWLSEHDPMLRMKGMVGIRLSPGKAVVEARVRLHNRSPLPQTFLWWANVAVRVHDHYQSFFPPDVTFVADHAKRAISSFPVAKNEYYGVDYRPGTDITWYKNIPVPTSYMITQSKYDFCGGYDHARGAGLVHTANHLIAPGKKMWTWGNAEFGHAWDRNLTDEGGPYVELMAGAFTDNQPDFSWLQPYETKTFSQYWYPIQEIGPAKNANTEAAVNLELSENSIRIGVCLTTPRAVQIVLTHKDDAVIDETIHIAPGEPFTAQLSCLCGAAEDYKLTVFDSNGTEVIRYQPENRSERALPEPAKEPLSPSQIGSNEELYLTGLHLEQYRHATRDPEPYYREGLLRDPDDARINNAVGLLELRRGGFAKAETHFARAVARLTVLNPNPYDGEAYYNLGLARMYQGRIEEAYEAFHKCVWNHAWRSAGYYALACISTRRGQPTLALQQLEECLRTNTDHLKARALRASLWRQAGRMEDAAQAVREALSIDPLDFRTLAESYLLTRQNSDLVQLWAKLGKDIQTLLDVVFDLASSGLPEDALDLLTACVETEAFDHPMLWYTASWLARQFKDESEALEFAERAEKATPLYCFPARVEEMIVLEDAIRHNTHAARAHYYLGNLYYDKRRYAEAIACWRNAVELDETFSIPFRNLGIAEFNVLNDPARAMEMYRRAFAANPSDARLLYEWDQLKKRTRMVSPEERLRFLELHRDLVALRDDLTVEYVTLLNQLGKWQTALDHLGSRRFSPWEGGEGLVSTQYVFAHRALGQAALMAREPAQALQHFAAARKYPENLGEGKHLLTLERDLDYYSGLAAQQLNDQELAESYWKAASAPLPRAGLHSYFRAQALRVLEREEEAHQLFEELRAVAQEQMETEPGIDYFATSLPNLLLFKDDPGRRNRLDALLLMAQAEHGLGNAQKATDLLEELVLEDPNTTAPPEMLRWLKSEVKPAIGHSEGV
jgi:tetratricopeptide (TPR) repeat protein